MTGHGIAGNVSRNFGPFYIWSLVLLLFVAKTVNFAADLGAMADSLKLLIGGPSIACSAVRRDMFALGIIGTGLLAIPVLAGIDRLRHRRRAPLEGSSIA